MRSKIIILNYGLHIAGVSRALVNFANALVARGYDVTIKLESNDFTLAKDLDSRVRLQLFLKEWRIFGVRVPGFLRFYSFFLKQMMRIPPNLLHQMIVGSEYDVEIAFNRGAAARIIAASDNKNSKKLVWVHSDYLRCENPLAGFSSLTEARNAYSKYDSIVCVSNQAKVSFEEKFGSFPTTAVKNNIFAVDAISKKAATGGLLVQRPFLCAIGRICDAKNYPMLLDAVNLLNHRGLDFDLWIVGDGELMPEIRQQKERLNLVNVKLLGAKENPYPYLAQADGYVCSSIYEGLSTTTIEALILGKACVVTDCTGMRDILGDSEYGLVVPITAEALADGMQQILQDKALRNRYEKKALERAAFFSPERCMDEIESLWS